MNLTTLRARLAILRACPGGCAWVASLPADATAEDAWRRCPRADWLVTVLGRLAERGVLARNVPLQAMCAAVRPALDPLPRPYSVPHAAFEIVTRFVQAPSEETYRPLFRATSQASDLYRDTLRVTTASVYDWTNDWLERDDVPPIPTADERVEAVAHAVYSAATAAQYFTYHQEPSAMSASDRGMVHTLSVQAQWAVAAAMVSCGVADAAPLVEALRAAIPWPVVADALDRLDATADLPR